MRNKDYWLDGANLYVDGQYIGEVVSVEFEPLDKMTNELETASWTYSAVEEGKSQK